MVHFRLVVGAATPSALLTKCKWTAFVIRPCNAPPGGAITVSGGLDLGNYVGWKELKNICPDFQCTSTRV